MSNAPSSRRVLVVDDNVDAAELTAAYLSALGYDVMAVHDGVTAMEAVSSFHPSVVLLDIGLPIIDGYDLARRLRTEYGRDLKLIAMTGYGQRGDRARGEAAGFDVYLVKPVDLDELAHLLEA